MNAIRRVVLTRGHDGPSGLVNFDNDDDSEPVALSMLRYDYEWLGEPHQLMVQIEAVGDHGASGFAGRTREVS